MASRPTHLCHWPPCALPRAATARVFGARSAVVASAPRVLTVFVPLPPRRSSVGLCMAADERGSKRKRALKVGSRGWMLESTLFSDDPCRTRPHAAVVVEDVARGEP